MKDSSTPGVWFSSEVETLESWESSASFLSGIRRALMRGREAHLFGSLCLVALFVITSAASFSSFYEKWHFREAGARGYDPVAGFEQMIDGTAHRPYVYRQLLPDLANWFTRILPRDIEQRIPARAKERISTAFHLEAKKYPAQYLILYILSYLSALLATFALYLVCRAVGLASPAAAFTAVVFMLLFPLIGVKGGYFFDYPELLFMSAATWIALKSDWWWLVPIAAIGTWNKESFLLFILTLYPLLRRRNSQFTARAAIGILAATCVAVYLPIRHHFAQNPGGTVEWHLRDQVDFYIHPLRMDTWIDRTYDLMFPALSSPICTLLLIWLVWRTWRFLPDWLKRHSKIAAAINIPLFLLFCQPGEFRDLSLLYVSFVLIIAFNVQKWMQPHSQPLLSVPLRHQA